MSGGPLAIPTFVCGARDDVAATDVYTKKTSAPINSIQTIATRSEVLNGAGGGLLKGVKNLLGGKSMLGGMPKISSLIAIGKAVAAGKGLSPLAQLSLIGGPVANAMKGLQPGLASGILSGMSSATNIIGQVGNIKSAIQSGNLANAAGIGNLVNSLTGGAAAFSMVDGGLTANALSGVINMANASGMGNVYGTLMSGAGITDPKLLSRVANDCLPGVIKACDLGSLRSMADLTPSGALKMLNPNILNGVAQNFSIPLTDWVTVSVTPVQRYQEVLGTFDKIDPLWAAGTRSTSAGFESMTSLTSIQGGSPDFLSMLESGVRSTPDATFNQQCTMLAPMYPKTDVFADLGKDFPMTALQGNSSSRTTTSDPRTVVVMQQVAGNLTPEQTAEVKRMIAALTSKYERDLGFMDRVITDRKAAYLSAKASGNYTEVQLLELSREVDEAVQDRKELMAEYKDDYQRLTLKLTTIT